MSKGLVLSIAIFAAFIIGGAGATFAGEVTGTGDLTPIEGFQANSICSFSGLQDGDIQPDDVQPGIVQNFGNHDPEGTGVSDDPENNAPSGPGRAAPGFACSPGEPS